MGSWTGWDEDVERRLGTATQEVRIEIELMATEVTRVVSEHTHRGDDHPSEALRTLTNGCETTTARLLQAIDLFLDRFSVAVDSSGSGFAMIEDDAARAAGEFSTGATNRG